MPNWSKMARREAIRAGIDPDIFDAQMRHESAGYNEDVIRGRRTSSAGALGIAQIMPETAKGWGVNPLNPQAALRAAAQNMREYIKKFGSYEKALRAYNAGPGAVEKSYTYPETNNYVKIILGGKQPQPLQGGAGPSRSRDVNDTSTQQPENPVSRLREIFARMEPIQSEPLYANPVELRMDPYGFGAKIEQNLQRTSELLGSLREQNQPTQAMPSRATGGIPMGGTPNGPWKGLKEIFWQGGKGNFNWDEGAPRPQGYVSGHDTHAHIAAGPKNIQRIIGLAEQMGVPVTSTTGGKHTEGSYHYSGRAVDVGGDSESIAKFVRRIRKLFGV